MEIKILDFLLTLGKICEERQGNCRGCPLWNSNGLHSYCIRTRISEEQNAELVKKVVLEQMKGEQNDSR